MYGKIEIVNNGRGKLIMELGMKEKTDTMIFNGVREENGRE